MHQQDKDQEIESLSVQALLARAETGDTACCLMLGRKYETGDSDDITVNVRTAAKWYLKAAELEDAEGQMLYAKMLLLGKGVAQDSEEAAQWYLKAAENGHMVAQYNVGEMYGQGRTMPLDHEKSRYWFERSAEQGHPEAQKRLNSNEAE